MNDGTRLQRARALIDRLPSSATLVTVGFIIQLGVVTIPLASREGTDGVQLAIAGAPIAVVIITGVVVCPALLLLWRSRLHRTAATVLVIAGVGMLIVSDGYRLLWVFPAVLLFAAVRAWAGAGLDAADLILLDPGRFERIEPPSSGDSTQSDSKE